MASGSAQASPLQVEQKARPTQKAEFTCHTLFYPKARATPLVLGYGVGTFYSRRGTFSGGLFMTRRSGSSKLNRKTNRYKERIKFEDDMLDLYMPARGCTAWLKQKFVGIDHDHLPSQMPARKRFAFLKFKHETSIIFGIVPELTRKSSLFDSELI